MPQAKQIAFIIIALVIGLAIGGAAGYFARPPAAPPEEGAVKKLPEEIPIGGLFALTGPLSSYGKRQKTAAELAISDINDYLAKLGYDVRFVLISEDTKVSKEEALRDIQTLAARGVKVVLGPLASSEVAAVKGFADEHEIVVISHASTAPALGIAGDFVFRFVPTDVFQGKALATIAWSLGLKKVVVLYRGDEWGEGLYEAFKENLEAKGGTVEAVKYDPKAKELSAEARRVSDLVKDFGGPSPEVGVLLISFEDDGVAALTAAKDDPVLTAVTWLGCDGTAMSAKIAEQAGDVAVKTGGLMSTVFAPTTSPKQEEFKRRMEEILGESPDPYCYNIYDAAWVAALSIIEAGVYDGETIRKVLPDVASRYFGVSGWCVLDENGDRAGGDYLIYKVVETPEGYVWVEAGVYHIVTDSVTWFEG